MRQPKPGMSLKGLVYLFISLVMVALFMTAFGHGAASKGSDVMIRMHMDGSWDMYIFEPCPGSIRVKPQHDKDDPIHVVCER